MNLYRVVLCLTFVWFFSVDCNKGIETEGDYVPGQVIVGLVDTVSYTTVVNFFSSLNLEIISLDIGYAFWIKADSGSLAYYRTIFSADSNIEYIDQLTFYDDTLRMVIACYGIIEVEEAQKRIEAEPFLHIYNTLIRNAPRLTWT
jgi:hypothetical protein